MTYTIVSTGYEKEFALKNEFEEPCVTIKQKLCDIIWEAFTGGVDSFYVNCEYGIPLWAAEIVCALKKYNNIYLYVIVPYEEQCRDWNENLRDRYYTVHEKADSVEFLDAQYYEDSYEEADKIMADNSDMVCIFGKNYTEAYISSYVSKEKIMSFYI